MVENTERYGPIRDSAAAIRERLNHEFASHPEKTSRALAAFCGVSEQAVYKWRRTGQIARDHLSKVAAFFGRGSHWLIAETRGDYATLRADEDELRVLESLRSLPAPIAVEFARHVANLAQLLRKA